MTLFDSATNGAWHSSHFSGARCIGALISGLLSHPRGIHDRDPEVPGRAGSDALDSRGPGRLIANAASSFLPRVSAQSANVVVASQVRLICHRLGIRPFAFFPVFLRPPTPPIFPSNILAPVAPRNPSASHRSPSDGFRSIFASLRTSCKVWQRISEVASSWFRESQGILEVVSVGNYFGHPPKA